jgi:hypothetical protein
MGIRGMRQAITNETRALACLVGLTQRPARQPEPTAVLDGADAIDTTAAADLDV